jgi:demethylmenaquinone methyltransferase/2-methoxy-6-polyprenyl-1,4-benzoquinol methylase
MVAMGNRTARRLFAPIASSYERWAAVLSLGQDARWRRRMVAGLGPPTGGLVLDVAAGTGSITRLLATGGRRVVALDLTREMLGRHPGEWRVAGRAEQLPFPAGVFDAVTFGYLLRYVDDPEACLAELGRVLRPGGRVGMVEFGLPGGGWRPLWDLYARGLLPAAGRIIGGEWHEVARFLHGSIVDFHQRWPRQELVAMWRRAGFRQVEFRRMSVGGGLIGWATKS